MPHPHILFITPVLFHSPSGLSTYYTNLFRFITRWQYRVSILIAGDAKIHGLSNAFMQSLGLLESEIRFCSFVQSKDGYTFPKQPNEAVNMIRELRPDVVWCMENSLFILEALAKVCNEIQRPLACRLHSCLETLFRRCTESHPSSVFPALESFLPLLLSSCTIVNTNDLKMAINYQAEHWKPRKEFRLQITPIDERIFVPNYSGLYSQPTLNQLKKIKDKIIINDKNKNEEEIWNLYPKQYWLYVGKLETEDGVKRLLIVWEHVNKGTILVILGQGSQLNWLKKRAPPEWIFYSQISRKTLPNLYQQAAGLITTHIYPSFGYVWLEAGLCACPLLIAVSEETENEIKQEDASESSSSSLNEKNNSNNSDPESNLSSFSSSSSSLNTEHSVHSKSINKDEKEEEDEDEKEEEEEEDESKIEQEDNEKNQNRKEMKRLKSNITNRNNTEHMSTSNNESDSSNKNSDYNDNNEEDKEDNEKNQKKKSNKNIIINLSKEQQKQQQHKQLNQSKEKKKNIQNGEQKEEKLEENKSQNSEKSQEQVSPNFSIFFSSNSAYREWKTEEECAKWINQKQTWTSLNFRKSLWVKIGDFQRSQLHYTASLFQELVHLKEY